MRRRSAELPLPDGPFEHAEVLRDPYVLVLPADADEPDTTTLAAAAGLDLIGFRHCRGLNQLETFSPEPLRFVFTDRDLLPRLVRRIGPTRSEPDERAPVGRERRVRRKRSESHRRSRRRRIARRRRR